MIRHHFTVDVEEYFHAGALEPWVARTAWCGLESRAEDAVARILELLDSGGSRGTFFVLGWLARMRPGIVRRIADAGHEIASHGWDHRRVTELDPHRFRASVRDTRRCLEDLSGEPVVGFRAPNFSIVPGWEWALDVLIEEGYRYDSSIFPIRRPGYGYPGAERDPHRLDRPSGSILEFPPATLRVLGGNVPAGGGAYFRILPDVLARWALSRAERRGTPATFYIHPWELDPNQPRLAVPALTRLRHYHGLARTEDRLRTLVERFRFQPIVRTVERGWSAPGAHRGLAPLPAR